MKLAVSAGDLSGDMYGAHLIRELKRISPDLELRGMGGPRMQREGLPAIANLIPYSTVGFVEPLLYLRPIYSAFRKMKKLLKTNRPDALVLIDYQGFNMALAGVAKKMGIRTIYFIPPQEWLWGTPKGVEKVARTIDLIISIFPKENEIYRAAGGHSIFLGHPLPEIMGTMLSREEFFQRLGVKPRDSLIALFPGTRTHEIIRHLPLALDVVRRLREKSNSFLFCIGVQTKEHQYLMENIVRKAGLQGAVRFTSYSRDLLAHADLALGKPGTILMEAVILGTPYIAYYKISPLSYWIAKNVLKIKMPFYTMVNLMMGQSIVPEFIQDNATPAALAEAVLSWVENGASRQKVAAPYEELRKQLDRGPIISKIAEQIVQFTVGGH